MAQTRTLQRRIRSVKNARQITKALEVVAASRMRRVVQAVEGSRAYADMATEIIGRVSPSPEAKSLSYFAGNPDKPALYIVISSDRGQAGAFNSNVFNLTLSMIRDEKREPSVVAFGRKGAHYFAHLHNLQLAGTYEDIPDTPEANVFAPVMEMVQAGMENNEFGKVVIVYTRFVSSLSQKAAAFQLFPIEAAETAEQPAPTKVFEFEPEINDVLEEGIRLYMESRLIQARIESAASEQAMRMVAMGNATRNASDLIDTLTLELNATRQAAITQEIAEITGGAAAITA